MAGARTLSPEEALSAALNTATNLKHAPAQTQYALSRTVTDTEGAPAVYLFSNTDSGFIVTPADDCAEATVLGYGTVTGETLPPNMQAWLDEYARQIEWLRNNPSAAQSSTPRRAPDTKAPIYPLCSSTWGQDAPFNNECPTVDGWRCPTGCLATAMAQIMYYYQHPAQGSGSKSYEWTLETQTYSDSFNFGNTTFDWANMADSYRGSYTAAQAQAVASLMHACGVAAEMNYSPEGSGASEYIGAEGLVNYLGYDKGMTVYSRDWFDNNAWDTFIYNELAASRPVLYCGYTANLEGHAFVCDGYSANGFFHINWGWDGIADGYFILSMLSPDIQGTGGADSGLAFNYYQRVVTNIKPAVEGSSTVPMIETDGILTDKASYSTSERIKFLNGFWNCAIATLNYDVAIAFKHSDGTVTYASMLTNAEIAVLYGYTSFSLPASVFPTSEYDFYFVFRESGSEEWQRFYCNNSGANAVHCVKTNSGLTLSAALYDGTPLANYSASITGVTPQTSSDGAKYYPRHTYDLSATVTATADADTYIAPVLCRNDGGNNEILSVGAAESCSLTAQQSSSVVLPLTIPSTVTEGAATLGIAIVDRDSNEVLNMLSTLPIKVEQTITAEDVIKVDIFSDDDAPAEFFNLQGIPVANPAPGSLLIRRQGSKAEKVLIR